MGVGALVLAELAKFIENKRRKKRWWTGESSSDAYAHNLDLHHVTNTGKNFEIWTEGRSRGKQTRPN